MGEGRWTCDICPPPHWGYLFSYFFKNELYFHFNVVCLARKIIELCAISYEVGRVELYESAKTTCQFPFTTHLYFSSRNCTNTQSSGCNLNYNRYNSRGIFFRLSIEVHSSVPLSADKLLLLNTVRSEKFYNSAKHIKRSPDISPLFFLYWEIWTISLNGE